MATKFLFDFAPPKNLIVIILLLLIADYGQSFSSGAPSWPTICSSMTPGHLFTPQPSKSLPYLVEVDKSIVEGGDIVTVTLSAPKSGPPFKGFLVMGRKDGHQNQGKLPPQGKFLDKILTTNDSSKKNENEFQLTNCSDLEASSVTHKTSKDKRHIILYWQAPYEEEDGSYFFETSFVTNFTTYWIQAPSKIIEVTKKSVEKAPKNLSKGQPHNVLRHEDDPLDDGDDDGMFQKMFKSVRNFMANLF